jgi:general secretion pathway protein H
MAAARRRAPGFTLIEMLVVLALIAAASALAAGVLTGGLAGLRLRSSANTVAAQLRYTRAQALATGEAQRFVIDPRAHRWSAPHGHHGALPPTLGVAFIGARETQPSPGEGAIVFFPDGASTGGRVQLSAKSARWNVDVAWLTGEVKVARQEAAQ